MARVPLLIVGLGALSGGLALPTPAVAQQSLGPIRASGQSVTPAFEGWYRNPDGTYSISFGYFNRNAKETLDIAIGPDNSIAPGAANQGQPAHFEPRRHWGVFTVKVPADFGKQKVTWTLKNRGESYAISGSLDPLWEIDALEGEAGSGNTPPVLKFADDGPEGRGPGGLTATGPTGRVGVPLTLSVAARDDGKAAPSIATSGRGEIPVTLTWFKHQGPGDVTFAPPTARVPNAGGKATTMATFSAPGEYVVRVRANDASGVAGAGHAQCCWTNGFIKVTVTP
jgi:hypothetical protein